MAGIVVEVATLHMKPPIRRRLVVPSDFTFRELEQAIDMSYGRAVSPVRLFMDPKHRFTITDREFKAAGERVDMRPASEPVAAYRGQMLAYSCDYRLKWLHAVSICGEEADYDLPYPTLVTAEGPSPGDDFETPDDFADLLGRMHSRDRGVRESARAEAEALGLDEPDFGITNAFLQGVVLGVDNSYYRASTLESAIRGRTWEQGPPEPLTASFYAEMDAHRRDRDPGDVPRASCGLDWPSYSDLSEEQLRWYLHWRSECLAGRPSREDRGYVWLYCAELIEMRDVSRAEALVMQLAECYSDDNWAGSLLRPLLFLGKAIPLSRGVFPRLSAYWDAERFPGAGESFYCMLPHPCFRPEDAESLFDDSFATKGRKVRISPEEFLDLTNSVLADLQGEDAFPDWPTIASSTGQRAARRADVVLDGFPSREPRLMDVPDGDTEQVNQMLILYVPNMVSTILRRSKALALVSGLSVMGKYDAAVDRWMDAHPDVRARMKWRRSHGRAYNIPRADAEPMPALKIKVTITGTEPPVYRILAIPDDFTFEELEQAIDISFGRTYAPNREFLIHSARVVVNGRAAGCEYDGIPYEGRTSDEPLADHRGESMVYTPDKNFAWEHKVQFMGTDAKYDLPHPALIKASGPSPGDDFRTPQDFARRLRHSVGASDPLMDILADLEDDAELVEPDPSIINIYLEDVTLGSGNLYYRTYGDESVIPGRMWEDGPPEHPGQAFYDDMDRYRDAPGTDAPYASCSLDWPKYSDLSEEQLAWYLHWRAECFEGRPSVTDRGYVWLLLTELADSDDFPESEAIRNGLYDAYRDNGGDETVREWINYHNCAVPVLRGGYPFRMPYEYMVMIDGAGEAFYGSGLTPRFIREDASDLLAESFSGYDVGISAPDFLDMTNHVLEGVHRYCLDRYGRTLPRVMLPDAPCREYEVDLGVPFRTPIRFSLIDVGDRETLNRGLICAVPFTLAKELLHERFGESMLEGDVLDEALRLMDRWLDEHPDVRDGIREPESGFPPGGMFAKWTDGMIKWADGPDKMPGPGFFEDMDRIRGMPNPGDVLRVGCDMPWPEYSDLSEEQLRWYVHWRALCEDTAALPEDQGYVWLYLAELADSGDVDHALDMMEELMGADSDLEAPLNEFGTRLILANGLTTDIPTIVLASMPDSVTGVFFSEPTAGFDVMSAGLGSGATPGQFTGVSYDQFAELCSYCLAELARTVREEDGKRLLEAMFPDLDFYEMPVYGWIPDRQGRKVLAAKGDDWKAHAYLSIPAVVGNRLRRHGLIGGSDARGPLLGGRLDRIAEDAADRWLRERGLI